jgi:Peptidase family S41
MFTQLTYAGDIILANKNSSYNPSPVKKINNVDVKLYLETYLATVPGWVDDDTRYNQLFYSLVADVQNQDGGFPIINYDGAASWDITFVNGSHLAYNVVASSANDFDGVDSGDAFFEAFCNATQTSATSNSTSSTAAPSSPTATSTAVAKPTPVPFPGSTPISGSADGNIAGYFLSNSTDTAVLSIITFEVDDQHDFSNTVKDFLAKCRSSGKSKLIIDVRGNPGGDILLPFDAFQQLFPQMYPYFGMRYRAHEALEILTYDVSKTLGNLSSSNIPGNLQALYYEESQYDSSSMLMPDTQSPYPSWEAFYGPHSYSGDNFTSVILRDFNNPYLAGSQDDGVGFYISGYGNRSLEYKSQTFTPDNIVYFTDGMCSSSCFAFSEILRTQAGVKTLVIGGRPRTGPMQAVGGIRGGLAQALNAIQSNIQDAVANFSQPLPKHATGSTFNTILNDTAVPRRDPAQKSGVNLLDTIRKGDSTQTPVQMLYEAADCRIFYTTDMVFDAQATWEFVRKAKWGNGGCVAGSTGHPSSLSGGAIDVGDFITKGLDFGGE